MTYSDPYSVGVGLICNIVTSFAQSIGQVTIRACDKSAAYCSPAALATLREYKLIAGKIIYTAIHHNKCNSTGNFSSFI